MWLDIECCTGRKVFNIALWHTSIYKTIPPQNKSYFTSVTSQLLQQHQHLTSRTMWKGWILAEVAIMSYNLEKLRDKTMLNKYHFINIIIFVPQMKVFSCHIGVASFNLHTAQSVYVLIQGDGEKSKNYRIIFYCCSNNSAGCLIMWYIIQVATLIHM